MSSEIAAAKRLASGWSFNTAPQLFFMLVENSFDPEVHAMNLFLAFGKALVEP